MIGNFVLQNRKENNQNFLS